MKELIVPHESQEAELVLGGFQKVDAKRQVNVDVCSHRRAQLSNRLDGPMALS